MCRLFTLRKHGEDEASAAALAAAQQHLERYCRDLAAVLTIGAAEGGDDPPPDFTLAMRRLDLCKLALALAPRPSSGQGHNAAAGVGPSKAWPPPSTPAAHHASAAWHSLLILIGRVDARRVFVDKGLGVFVDRV